MTKQKITIIGSIIIILFIIVVVAYFIVKPKPWEQYYQKNLEYPAREFVVKNLKYVAPFKEKIALDLGSGSGNEAVLLLEMGFYVFAVDEQPHAFEYMQKQENFKNNQQKIKMIVSSFEALNYADLPQVDLVIASYSLPFIPENSFDIIWSKIVDKIKPGGFFIGTFFAPDITHFEKEQKKEMSFHTKKQVIKLLEEFKIIKFKEVKLKKGDKDSFDHYFEVVAKKKK